MAGSDSGKPMTRWLLAFSVLMLTLNAVLVPVQDVFMASGIAPELAPRLGVEENLLRTQLQEVLHANWENRLVAQCLPWLIIIGIIGFSAISEFSRGGRRREGHG
jgi:hypothetical protein